MLKFLVYLDNKVIAIRFNSKKKQLVVGGHFSAEQEIRVIAREYFGRTITRVAWVQANKLRLNFQCDIETFEMGKNKLENQGISFEAVKSFGRIMR